ncbi:MAG: radical SAM protein [Deltaproteobacteria bacterium]|nr:radical SAM protein [Deltaproteobacteria bacterium]
MQQFRPEQLVITVEKNGSRRFIKSGQPTRFGKYAEIRTLNHEFHFNLNGQIRFIRGLSNHWPHPFESLKRTDGNDWVYYTVGAAIKQQGIRNWLGEYYLPCFAYRSNAIVNFTPYFLPAVTDAFAAWSQLYANICTMPMDGFPSTTRAILNRVAENDDSALHARTENLHSIIGGQVSVLPPDTRHVDYEVIPLNISDGCFYHCKFCCVKSSKRFQLRSKKNILEQIRNLKDFYGRNLKNYNSIFIGNHDALGAGGDLVYMAASEAFDIFDMENANISDPRLFMFGSVDSFLKAGDSLFENLDRLPFFTHINIGLESVDAETLAEIGKPLTVANILTAFRKMTAVNRTHKNIEITANFLLGDPLSEDHHQSLADLLGNVSDIPPGKGAIYLSPMAGHNQESDELLQSFFTIKNKSKMPVFIYLIQRL